MGQVTPLLGRPDKCYGPITLSSLSCRTPDKCPAARGPRGGSYSAPIAEFKNATSRALPSPSPRALHARRPGQLCAHAAAARWLDPGAYRSGRQKVLPEPCAAFRATGGPAFPFPTPPPLRCPETHQRCSHTLPGVRSGRRCARCCSDKRQAGHGGGAHKLAESVLKAPGLLDPVSDDVELMGP